MPRLVDGSESVELIHQLRLEVWGELLSQWMTDAEIESLLCTDPTPSVHWVVRNQGGAVVAAARMSMHEDLSRESYASHFPGLAAESLAAPVAWFARLVIHPRYRGWGVSRALDKERVDRARAADAGCAVAFVRDRRLHYLVREGWQIVCSSDYPDGHPMQSRGQHAVVRHLR